MKPRSHARRKPARRRDEAKELFRNAILEAAEQVFAEMGFHAAKIQVIADRARIGVGTVYNHFADKEAVLSALMDARKDEVIARLQAVPGEPPDFAGRLTARIRSVLEYVDSHRGFFWILMGYGPGADTPGAIEVATKRMEKFKAAFRALVQEGIDDGALAKRDPAHLSAFLGGSIRAFTLGALKDPRPMGDHVDEIVDLFLHGAAARKGR